VESDFDAPPSLPRCAGAGALPKQTGQTITIIVLADSELLVRNPIGGRQVPA
jgi:hypothetical protein